jgi:hypothetical protein
MGRMPLVSFTDQATLSVAVSIAVITLEETEPETANLPSGVTYTL